MIRSPWNKLCLLRLEKSSLLSRVRVENRSKIVLPQISISEKGYLRSFHCHLDSTYSLFPVIQFSAPYSEECLGLLVYYVRDGTVLAENCIRARPNWMHKNMGQLKSKRLTELRLPGTHNSGAYTSGYRWLGYRQWLEDRYTICQDESVLNQLIYGIRYWDMSVLPNVVRAHVDAFLITEDTCSQKNILDWMLL